jgi:hypothetical protein
MYQRCATGGITGVARRGGHVVLINGADFARYYNEHRPHYVVKDQCGLSAPVFLFLRSRRPSAVLDRITEFRTVNLASARPTIGSAYRKCAPLFGEICGTSP